MLGFSALSETPLSTQPKAQFIVRHSTDTYILYAILASGGGALAGIYPAQSPIYAIDLGEAENDGLGVYPAQIIPLQSLTAEDVDEVGSYEGL